MIFYCSRNSTEEHQRDLIIVLQELERDGWCVNWDKCAFFKINFEYLGVKLTPTSMELAAKVL